MELHEWLRHLRETQGLNQAQLAKKLDIPRWLLSRIESGNRKLQADELGMILHALGGTIEVKLQINRGHDVESTRQPVALRHQRLVVDDMLTVAA